MTAPRFVSMRSLDDRLTDPEHLKGLHERQADDVGHAALDLRDETRPSALQRIGSSRRGDPDANSTRPCEGRSVMRTRALSFMATWPVFQIPGEGAREGQRR